MMFLYKYLATPNVLLLSYTEVRKPVVVMCMCSAAGPPGLSPASAADRAGSQHGYPEEVCPTRGGAEEVSDGHHAEQQHFCPQNVPQQGVAIWMQTYSHKFIRLLDFCYRFYFLCFWLRSRNKDKIFLRSVWKFPAVPWVLVLFYLFPPCCSEKTEPDNFSIKFVRENL